MYRLLCTLTLCLAFLSLSLSLLPPFLPPPSPTSALLFHPHRETGGPTSKYAVSKSYCASAARVYENGLAWLERECLQTFGFTRLQFSMTKDFWWSLCRARIERRDAGSSDAQFSYRRETVELPTIVFHHIESFGLPFTLEDVCHNLRADYQQITNKLWKWRHPTDGMLVEPQACAVILGRTRRLFRLHAQELGVEMRFAEIIDGVCQAFVHNHVRHVTPFGGFVRDKELASCTLFAVISNHLLLCDNAESSPPPEVRSEVITNKRRRRGGIKVLKLLKTDYPLDMPLYHQSRPNLPAVSVPQLSKISQFAPIPSKSRSSTQESVSHTQLAMAVRAEGSSPKRERSSTFYSILTGAQHALVEQKTSFLTKEVDASQWSEYYRAWEREWTQLHSDSDWSEFTNSVYASYGQFLAFTNQCHLLVRHPLILQYVGRPLPFIQ